MFVETNSESFTPPPPGNVKKILKIFLILERPPNRRQTILKFRFPPIEVGETPIPQIFHNPKRERGTHEGRRRERRKSIPHLRFGLG